jgi:nucleolar GTP-binding protein
MPTPFADLPGTTTAEELVDQAFSRATRAGRAKTGREAQESMVRTAGNVVSDNLENVVRGWPDFDRLDPFYAELAAATVDVDAVRSALSSVGWAGRKTDEIRREALGRVQRAGDADLARKHRKQAFARLADVVESVEEDLQVVQDARGPLVDLPELRPDRPAVVVAGVPNVGKTAFVNAVTRATNETAGYPFTTTAVAVGHLDRDRITYQIVDTPGLLDRPADQRNDVEARAVAALTHLADAVLYVFDASEACGYPLDDQRALCAELRETFDAPVVTVCNKVDRSRAVEADQYMSVTEDEGVEETLAAVLDATGYEPELPFEG